nr:hypothetical protein [Tanacetum cinerariifolium]
WRRGCGGHGGVLVSAAGVADEAWSRWCFGSVVRVAATDGVVAVVQQRGELVWGGGGVGSGVVARW